MKKILQSIMAIATTIMLVAFPGWAKGQTTASATVDARATLIDIIKLTKIDDLNFGRVANGTTGNVVLATNGQRTATGVIPLGESGWFPAKFEVRGANDYEYYIGLPTDVIVKNGVNEIMINNLVAKASTATEDGLIGIVKFDSFFTVGGKLNIESATLPAGNYTTNFEISVGYN